jgi:oligosaccharyl transferase (archaeosortase A-associated)
MGIITERTGPKDFFRALDAIILVVIFGIALSLRVIPLHQAVFDSGWVNFQGPDPWYHVRLIQNLLQHFPFRINFDPYSFFPIGQSVWFAPLFDELIAFWAWVIGLGSPSLQTIYAVAAYFPAVLGALVSVPVYFIGKILLNNKAGLIAALLVCILPGSFLMVSVLGYVDHHVAEVLFSTTAVLFLLLALKQVQKNQITFAQVRRQEWNVLKWPLIFAVLSGIALGAYLLTWVGGLFFVFLFFCWVVIMYVIGHLRKESTDYLCIIGVPVFLIALIMVVPFLDQLAFGEINIVSLVIGIVIFPILSGISKFAESKGFQRAYYPLILLGIGAIGLIGLHLANPALFRSMLQQFQVFTPDTNLLTITEVRPLFFQQGPFSLTPYWNSFTTATVTAPLGFILLLIMVIRKVDAGKILFLLWALMMFVATTGQIRFSEYLTVNFALLGAIIVWQLVVWIPAVLKYFEFKKPSESYRARAKKTKAQARLARGNQVSALRDSNPGERTHRRVYQYLYIGLAAILIFFLGIFPNIQLSIMVSGINSGVSNEWYDALTWMKTNTPEPFQDNGYFNKLYQKPASGRYNYPSSAYGVLSWWDYGHYITQIAQRIPNSNPNQSGASSVATFLTAQNEGTADKLLDQMGTRYVMIDLNMVTPYDNNFMTKMFSNVPPWAGKDLSQFCEIYFQMVNGKYTPVTLFYPEYYYTMDARLYNFQGQRVIPANSTIVISSTEKAGYNLVQSSQTFPTYEEARAFISGHTSGNYRIVGTSPFVTPVPLEKLDHYEMVFGSKTYIVDNINRISRPFVTIFKYTP